MRNSMEKISLNQLTIEEKMRLICGKDFWHTCDFDGKIPNVSLNDASMGVRIPINPEKWEGDKPIGCLSVHTSAFQYLG